MSCSPVRPSKGKGVWRISLDARSLGHTGKLGVEFIRITSGSQQCLRDYVATWESNLFGAA